MFVLVLGLLFMVVEQFGCGDCVFDIYFCLLREWIIFFGIGVDDVVVDVFVVQMFFFEVEDLEKDIQIYINFLGGLVIVGLVIYDMMQQVVFDVVIICYGFVVSMGVFLFFGGIKGKCFVLLNVWIMIY